MFRLAGHLAWCVALAGLLGGMYGRLYGWTPHHALAPTALLVVGVAALILGGLLHKIADQAERPKKSAAKG